MERDINIGADVVRSEVEPGRERASARKLDPAPAGAPPRYRWPAEWERHEATWIAWPHHEPDWPGKLGPIPWVYAEIVRALHEHERVEILCHSEAVAEAARGHLAAHSVSPRGYRLHHVPNDPVWGRDSGPRGVYDAARPVTLIKSRINA